MTQVPEVCLAWVYNLYEIITKDFVCKSTRINNGVVTIRMILKYSQKEYYISEMTFMITFTNGI